MKATHWPDGPVLGESGREGDPAARLGGRWCARPQRRRPGRYSSRYSSIVSEVEFSGLAGVICASASALLS